MEFDPWGNEINPLDNWGQGGLNEPDPLDPLNQNLNDPMRDLQAPGIEPFPDPFSSEPEILPEPDLGISESISIPGSGNGILEPETQPIDHGIQGDDHDYLPESHNEITPGHAVATSDHDVENTEIQSNPEKPESLWNDSDYPFFPKPRGGGMKGKRVRMPKIRVPRLRVKRTKSLQMCFICGRFTYDYLCDICKILVREGIYCAYCFEPTEDGKCKNPDCPNFEPEICPECGGEMPCKCVT